MTSPTPIILLSELALVVDPMRDNVAVARSAIAAGTRISLPTLVMGDERVICLRDDVESGHRFAIAAVPAGDWLRQYGQPFARSLGHEPGDAVTSATIDHALPSIELSQLVLRTPELLPRRGPLPTFAGFRRADGRVGVRNWVLVVPTSMCSSHEANTIALQAELGGIYSRERYPNVDGVSALPHTRGCGCPDIQLDVEDRLPGSVETTLRMLSRYIAHPNVGAVLLLELGCEKTNLPALDEFIARDGALSLPLRQDSALSRFGAAHGKPVLSMSVQECGGTREAIRRGLELLPQLLAAANQAQRAPTPISELAIGLKCGGSDAFSGLTANPALGYASDLLVSAGANTLITEIPEFFGAEHLFAERAASMQVAEAIFASMERFRAYVARAGGSMAENPSPGNKAGGLLNITIKSLGALAKSGSAPVQGVLDYAEDVWERPTRGLHLLYCPSYDQESTPALVASGCQIVCFTTGRGTGIGNAIAPVIKLSSNSRLARRMAGDIDLDAGPIIAGQASIAEVGRAIFQQIIEVASGSPVQAELNGHREFMIWNEEGVSL